METQHSFHNVRIGVANRGIPALRIGRTIREMGGRYVAFFTEADKSAPHVSKADLAFQLPGADGYLNIAEIIRIAKENNVKALHPGWGFAAEDCQFPRRCHEADLVFIGPTEECMRRLGNKVEARHIAQSLGIPVVPGSEGALTLEEARSLARQIGYPAMIKSEGGGGGRGIVVVKSEQELEEHFIKASTMAEASFGNPNLYLEKYLEGVRHLEIQVLRDRYGSAVALCERDCSVQRKHQKLLEITPSPWKGMTEDLRSRLRADALRLVEAVNYDSIATIEFLVKADGNYYFIEGNTRLQVEHGITELLYGIDLVEEMIRIAFGEHLRLKPSELAPRGHALQCRINFEDPKKKFQPNAGRITRYLSPGGEGVRLDSCVFGEYTFPKAFDSAGALLMAHGSTWPKAVAVMRRALCEYIIGGLKTTIPFHKKIVSHPTLIAGEVETSFIENTPELMEYHDLEPEEVRLSYLAAEITAKGYNPYVALGRYRKFGDSRRGATSVGLPLDEPGYQPPFDPAAHREAFLKALRENPFVEFCNTTARDITQSNSGNRLRLYDDRRYGPIIDRCGYVSIENGGGAHYHVAMLGCMTDPWAEAEDWNRFAPHTQKLILIRSTNVLGYAPQSRKLMERTGRTIIQNYHQVRCFDFLNHIENMAPFAEIVLASEHNIFQPAISFSHAEGFDRKHYMGVLDDIMAMVARILGCRRQEASRAIILCLKDMAGMCPPRFVTDVVSAILDKYPDLVIQYHRHCTDGLAVPALGAAAKAGVKVLDVADGPAVRFYGQTAVLPVVAYLEEELGLRTRIDKARVREAAFALKQLMPLYDHYCKPSFLGPDHDVVHHGLPGGATSSSQEAALKQGYAFLLPNILEVLALCRKIIRYHDVTPGSQITWTNGYLMVIRAYERGGMSEVRRVTDLLRQVTSTPEGKLDSTAKEARLVLFRHANDALKNLLLGKFGKLPLGWPADWVYQSVFGDDSWRQAVTDRTEESPLKHLPPVDIDAQREDLARLIGRQPNENELVNYLNHPGDALKLIQNLEQFGDANCLPDDIWFEGLEVGVEREFQTSDGKPHTINVHRVGRVDSKGRRRVRYQLDQEMFVVDFQVEEPKGLTSDVEMADPGNLYHIGSPFDADLWIVHKKVGDCVKTGDEVLNLSLMKMECALNAPVDGVVKRVVVFANYKADKKMVPVKKGQLLMELAVPRMRCANCEAAVDNEFRFCPACGQKLISAPAAPKEKARLSPSKKTVVG
ncbi:MAG: pyruvate carboxylase [Pseudomonadota bacterium]